MTQRTIHITSSGSHWLVRMDAEPAELFATRDAALRAALMYAQDECGVPRPVEIRVVSSTGKEPTVSFTAVPGALAFN